VTGAISATNSLEGSTNSDHVGSGGITILFNNDFVISSPGWSNQTGAVTWGSAFTALPAMSAPRNSLVGASTGDKVGSGWHRPTQQ